jgi:hypothetical protein
MNWGMNLKANGERKKIKHTINNKLIKNLQGMNKGMNREKQHLKTAQNRKRRTEIEHCSKSVNRLPLNAYPAPFLTGTFKTGHKDSDNMRKTQEIFYFSNRFKRKSAETQICFFLCASALKKITTSLFTIYDFSSI